jgi:hypothetical protein
MKQIETFPGFIILWFFYSADWSKRSISFVDDFQRCRIFRKIKNSPLPREIFLASLKPLFKKFPPPPAPGAQTEDSAPLMISAKKLYSLELLD